MNEGAVPGKPFVRYTAQTPVRAVTFYLSDHSNGGDNLPLVVFVQGTGCDSHFQRGEKGKVVGGLALIVRESVANRAVVMAVEKPGVKYLDDFNPEEVPLEKCPAEFLRDYALDSWVQTIAAAIEAARTLPGINPDRVLVIGHSEGGIIALRLSNVSRSVTHAASLSGGGPTFLAHIADYSRLRGRDPEKDVYDCWKHVQAEPDATDKFCWGGTYHQWASFMRTSIIQEAVQSKAKLYFVHGSADKQNSIFGFDVLRAELAAHGRAAVFERIEGADHALDLPGQEPPEGLQQVFTRVVDWFLQDKGSNSASRHK